LSGREGFGVLSPSRRAYEAGFSAFHENETPIFHYAGGEKTEAKVQCVSHWKTVTGRWTGRGPGGPVHPVSSSRGQRHSAPRVYDRTLVWPDKRARSVHLGAEERRVTSASEDPRDRSVRLASLVWLGGMTRSGRGGVSGHVRPDASDRAESSLDSDRMPGAARLVIW
jgi:hypothetical protein